MSRFAQLPDRQLIEISGKDRGSFLQGIFSQDVAKNFPVGASVYGIFPNAKGRVLADAFVFHLDNQSFLLEVERSITEKLVAHLNQYLILSEVSVKLRPEKAISIFEGKSGISEDILFTVTRKGFIEERLWVLESKVKETIQKIGGQEIEHEAYEVILAQHGIPKLGREMDETTFPQEVGLDEALDFKKGCFIGAEVLQRIFYQGHVNRRLTILQSKQYLPPNSPVYNDDTEIGKVTYCFQKEDAWNVLALIKSHPDLEISQADFSFSKGG